MQLNKNLFLPYQLLKYQQRSGFSHRDALRLFHVKPQTDDHQLLYNWVVKGWHSLPSQIPSDALAQIWWYEWLKRNPSQTHEAIQKGRLTHEMAAPVGKMDKQAWQLLFLEMPIGAMLRNLGSLTEIGVLRSDEPTNLDRVEAVLNNPEYLRKGRIHPIGVPLADNSERIIPNILAAISLKGKDTKLFKNASCNAKVRTGLLLLIAP